jgi:hypothetical protein
VIWNRQLSSGTSGGPPARLDPDDQQFVLSRLAALVLVPTIHTLTPSRHESAHQGSVL